MKATRRPQRPHTPGAGFLKGLKKALAAMGGSRIAVVAYSLPRATFIRNLCERMVDDPQGLQVYTWETAAQALEKDEHHLVILDPSLDDLTRSALRMVARQKLATCKVLEIKKWSVEPPK